MDLDKLLSQLHSVYDGNDTPCEYGCSTAAIPKMIAAAKVLYPQKPYCVIAEWVWADIDLPSEQVERLKGLDLCPSFVRAGRVLDDEARRAHIVNSVRSTALVEFHRNALFITRNTSYILCGSGSRVTISPEAFSALQYW